MTTVPARFRRRPTALTRHVGAEILVSVWEPGRETDVTSLEGSAAAIWELLATPRDRSGLVTTAASVYDLDGDAIKPEIDAILDELCGRGLVEHQRDSA